MARKYTDYRCTCSICGGLFFARRIGSLYCSHKCKQVGYRKRKIEQALAEKFTLDLETYNLFQQVCSRTPDIVPMLTDFLKAHDKEAFKAVLNIVSVTQLSVT